MFYVIFIFDINLGTCEFAVLCQSSQKLFSQTSLSFYLTKLYSVAAITKDAIIVSDILKLFVCVYYQIFS